MPNLLYPSWKNAIATRLPLSNYEGVDRTIMKQEKLKCNGFTRICQNS